MLSSRHPGGLKTRRDVRSFRTYTQLLLRAARSKRLRFVLKFPMMGVSSLPKAPMFSVLIIQYFPHYMA